MITHLKQIKIKCFKCVTYQIVMYRLYVYILDTYKSVTCNINIKDLS